VAVPFATQGELNVTVADCVNRVPSELTRDADRLVLPPAESVGLEIDSTPGWNEPPVPLPICTELDPDDETT
jgi:hypothetical protein